MGGTDLHDAIRQALAMGADETVVRATEALMASYSLHRDPRTRMGGGRELDREEYREVVKLVLAVAGFAGSATSAPCPNTSDEGKVVSTHERVIRRTM